MNFIRNPPWLWWVCAAVILSSIALALVALVVGNGPLLLFFSLIALLVSLFRSLLMDTAEYDSILGKDEMRYVAEQAGIPLASVAEGEEERHRSSSRFQKLVIGISLALLLLGGAWVVHENEHSPTQHEVMFDLYQKIQKEKQDREKAHEFPAPPGEGAGDDDPLKLPPIPRPDDFRRGSQ